MAEPRAERPFMPDYGVETAAWTPLPWSWAAERLKGYRNLWIVTASATGRPHATPVWAVWWDAEARLMFACGPRARKARNIDANPRVTVAGDDTVEAITVEGRAALVDDEERRDLWIERYLAKYRPLSPTLDAAFLRSNRMYEVVAERAFAVIERDDEFATRATRWIFD